MQPRCSLIPGQFCCRTGISGPQSLLAGAPLCRRQARSAAGRSAGRRRRVESARRQLPGITGQLPGGSLPRSPQRAPGTGAGVRILRLFLAETLLPSQSRDGARVRAPAEATPGPHRREARSGREWRWRGSGGWLSTRDTVAQDEPWLLFHGASVVRCAHPQAGIHIVVEAVLRGRPPRIRTVLTAVVAAQNLILSIAASFDELNPTRTVGQGSNLRVVCEPTENQTDPNWRVHLCMRYGSGGPESCDFDLDTHAGELSLFFVDRIRIASVSMTEDQYCAMQDEGFGYTGIALLKRGDPCQSSCRPRPPSARAFPF